MKIGIANDHRGKELKFKIIDYLNNKNIEYVNYGTDTDDSVDYVDYALKLCNGINNHEVDLGILICGTGIGMSIAANKVKNIIAAKVNTPNEAALCREHNRANVMTLAEYTENLESILDNFINTLPSKEEKHIRRVNKVLKIQEI